MTSQCNFSGELKGLNFFSCAHQHIKRNKNFSCFSGVSITCCGCWIEHGSSPNAYHLVVTLIFRHTKRLQTCGTLWSKQQKKSITVYNSIQPPFWIHPSTKQMFFAPPLLIIFFQSKYSKMNLRVKLNLSSSLCTHLLNCHSPSYIPASSNCLDALTIRINHVHQRTGQGQV